MMVRRRFSWHGMLPVLVAAGVALAVGVIGYQAGAWAKLENDTVDLRFAARGAQPRPAGLVLVAIDDRTFSLLHRQWPFPRRLHGRMIDILRRDGARVIAYDVQFSEPTDPTDDGALYDAVARAGNVVLATTEVDAEGRTNVLGGPANLRAANAVAATANLPADPGGVIRRYPARMLGMDSFAVAVARRAGRTVAAGRFEAGSAPIDFRGGPGSIRTVSFADVLAGRIPPAVFAHRIVIVGATAPTLQDVHSTATTAAEPMAGAEVQADAIWTALHGNPLTPAPGWLDLVAIVVCALAAPVASLRYRVLGSALTAGVVVAGYLIAAQLAFAMGTELVVTYPLAAWIAGLGSMLVVRYWAAAADRNALARRLQASQLELLRRLAQAIDSRDAETGEHTLRIGLLCRRLALRIGWSEAAAQALMYASVTHDVGKIGIPDEILFKAGPLDADEWDVMKTHTTIGAQLLADSDDPLIRMAEIVARSHHERWDGSGYPDGTAGTAIPIEARICAVVDVYDALLSRRSYKEAWEVQDVLAEIARGSGSHFDPELVTAFLALAPELTSELSASYARERSAGARSVSEVSLQIAGVAGPNWPGR